MSLVCVIFFFLAAAPTEIYTLSLHDALPISVALDRARLSHVAATADRAPLDEPDGRSEEHTSELQSHVKLVCRLLLEKKNCFPTTVAASPRETMAQSQMPSARRTLDTQPSHH